MMENRLRIRQNKFLAFLAILHVLVVSTAIGNSGWTDTLDSVIVVGFNSAIIGLLISRSLLHALIAHLFSIVIGVACSFWVSAQLLPEQLTWRLRWEAMIERFIMWRNIWNEGQIIYDNLLFVFQMSLIIWAIGYLTVWYLFRSGKVWNAIVPGGVVLLSNVYYAPNSLTGYFLTFLFISILLVIKFNLFEHEQRWRANNIYFRSDIQLDFFRDGLIFSVLIIGLAWFAPSIGPKQTLRLPGKLDRYWREVQNEWNRAFASLNYKPDPLVGADSFSQNLTLGGPRKLTDDLVMMVDAPGGRYWRAAVYDEYDGFGWSSNDYEEINISSGQSIEALPFFRARQPLTQTYFIFREGATILYAMGYPISFDRGAVGKTSYVPSNQVRVRGHNYWFDSRSSHLEEITHIESDRRLVAEEPYQVISMVSAANEKNLRDSATDPYPPWIEDRYLQLPDDVSERVLNLAVQITENAETPYDKARAVERYLRQNIKYNERIAPPPLGRDKIEYILFDLKEAYCDYYATSMIIMLRSVGVPARLAAGYARGQLDTLDNQQQVFIVRNKNAHSWVEVFFPRYGWIDFEPTAAQPLVAREDPGDGTAEDPNLRDTPDNDFNREDALRDIDEPLGDGLPDTPTEQSGFQINFPGFGAFNISKAFISTIGGIFIGLFIVVGLGYTFNKYQQKQFASLPLTTAVYKAMIKLAAWLGLKKRPAQTAYEHAKQLKQVVPDINNEVDLITTEFVRHTFKKDHQVDDNTKSGLLSAWNNIRPALYRAIFNRKFSFKIRLPFKW